MLTPDGRRVLANLIFAVFTPALFFAKLGAGVGIMDALALW
jgi:predicted permease